ncbi:uncharacterized protein LOC119969297 isoform X3 [Scyliorhinus canicula]|uniref:uncharacterized protein LOC119969297 isoform X3 n=1 Tax=Scyliorhinus canicula TaxID=7830 RepID=UPI0018F47251|nr:uncharacterized protein LOC119969297 isoform X3 [Scyliorhinus canicula]
MKISSCNVKMQIWHSGSVVAETRSHSQGSEAVCRGEINIPSSLIGDFVIKGIPPPYYEYNGNGKFQIREQAYREEKEKDAILHIIVNLTKTKRFFIPGAPFRIWVCVTYPDRSPVSEALIKVGITSEDKYINVSKEVFTDDIGELGISFNVPENASKLHIKVSTRNKALETEESSEIVIESLAHNKAYLSIELPNVLLYPGDIIYVTLSAFSQLNINDVNYYYYMLLNKGKLLRFERIGRSDNTSFPILITKDMVPYFRIVAYYITNIKGNKISSQTRYVWRWRTFAVQSFRYNLPWIQIMPNVICCCQFSLTMYPMSLSKQWTVSSMDPIRTIHFRRFFMQRTFMTLELHTVAGLTLLRCSRALDCGSSLTS